MNAAARLSSLCIQAVLCLTCATAGASAQGRVVAWGLDLDQRLAVPAGLTDVVAVAAGGAHSIALRSDGTVAGWGFWDVFGDESPPAGLSGVVAISKGSSVSLALKSDGTVVGWGAIYPFDGSLSPAAPAGLSDVVAIDAGRGICLALKSDGTVVQWGEDPTSFEGFVAGLRDIVAVSAGDGHSMALRSDGTVVEWGFGVPDGGFASTLSGVVAISSGGHHNLALMSDSTVVVWGGNTNQELDIPLELRSPLTAHVVAISAGLHHSLALKSDGTVVAWGDNRHGQIDTPAGLTHVTAISAGAWHNVVVVSEVESTPFTVTGRVSAGCPVPGTGLLGVTVDAFEVGSGDLVGTATTDATGAYTLADLPGGSSYTITVVTPLGYAATAPEVQVDDGAAPVDFSLDCVSATGTPKSMGFWKHNVGVATGGRGSAQVGATTLCSYLDLIAAHFNSNEINQVVVYQPPASGVCADKLQVAKLLLDLKGSAGMLARAKQQLMALLLNVAAGYIHQTAVISADGATVSQAITFCDNLIDTPGGDYERAKTIADLINNGQQVPNGMVPIGTQVISYRLRPVGGTPTFALEGVRPNPASGNGLNVAFALPTEASARLELLDLSGRRVMSREVGSLGAGLHTLNLAEGRKVPPGIYWVRLTQGAKQRSTRVAVIG